jgi:hypothetical protein
METNLPELCRRVWAKVPEAQPDQFYFSNSGGWYVSWGRKGKEPTDWTMALPSDIEPSVVAMIQAAALRWLLDNNGQLSKAPNHDDYGVECQTLDDAGALPLWFMWHRDLTTCLLLAVERCQEYKAAEAARGEK